MTTLKAENRTYASTAGHKFKVSTIIAYIVLGVWMITCLFPVYWMFTFSLKTNDEIFVSNPMGIPQNWIWENYKKAWTIGRIDKYFINSLIVTVSSIVITMLAAAMATYAMTRMVWKGRKLMNKFFMLGLTIPIHVALVPLYRWFATLGLRNSYLALILPYSAFALAMAILISNGFMGDIPYDLDEAAFIDGCGVWGIFIKIICPLMVPAISTIGIYTFLQCWNELMFANILIDDNKFFTLPRGTNELVGQYKSEWGPIGASLTIATIPTLVVYILLSGRIRESFIAGAVKG